MMWEEDLKMTFSVWLTTGVLLTVALLLANVVVLARFRNELRRQRDLVVDLRRPAVSGGPRFATVPMTASPDPVETMAAAVGAEIGRGGSARRFAGERGRGPDG